MKRTVTPAHGLWPLGVALALSLTAAQAQADFNLSFNVRWEPTRYTLPEYATTHDSTAGGTRNATDIAQPGASGTATLPSTSSVSAFQRQDLAATIGIGFTDKFTLTVGIDFARATLNHNDSDTNATTRGFNTFGLSVGAKWNFIAPAKEKISPYIAGDFFKYFTALNDERPGNLPQNEVEFSASLAAPMGFRVAFGIEYYFNESFGIGADILGMQGAFASGSMRRSDGGNIVTHEQSLNSIAFYTALTLNFRFPSLVKYGGGSKYRYRERDDRE